MTITSQPGGVGVKESDRGDAEIGGEMAGLLEQVLGEIERGEIAITEVPHAQRGATGAATGFKQGGAFIGKETLDEDALGFPETEEMSGARVVNDRDGIVEVGANSGGGNFVVLGGHVQGSHVWHEVPDLARR